MEKLLSVIDLPELEDANVSRTGTTWDGADLMSGAMIGRSSAADLTKSGLVEQFIDVDVAYEAAMALQVGFGGQDKKQRSVGGVPVHPSEKPDDKVAEQARKWEHVLNFVEQNPQFLMELMPQAPSKDRAEQWKRQPPQGPAARLQNNQRPPIQKVAGRQSAQGSIR